MKDQQKIDANKSFGVIGIILSIILIGFLIIIFFITPELNSAQIGIIKLIYPLVAGFCTMYWGGEAIFRWVTEMKGVKIFFSATAGIAVFTFIYLNPPSFLKESISKNEEVKRIIVIDSFVRRYDKDKLVTNAEEIIDFIQEIDPSFETEQMLVGTTFNNHDDILRKKPVLLIIHLSSFFSSTNKNVDLNEFDIAMSELDALFDYILKNDKRVKILVYTRKTPESGQWPDNVHKEVIRQVQKQIDYINRNPTRMFLLELPWTAKFSQAEVKLKTKNTLREIIAIL